MASHVGKLQIEKLRKKIRAKTSQLTHTHTHFFLSFFVFAERLLLSFLFSMVFFSLFNNAVIVRPSSRLLCFCFYESITNFFGGLIGSLHDSVWVEIFRTWTTTIYLTNKTLSIQCGVTIKTINNTFHNIWVLHTRASFPHKINGCCYCCCYVCVCVSRV